MHLVLKSHHMLINFNYIETAYAISHLRRYAISHLLLNENFDLVEVHFGGLSDLLCQEAGVLHSESL